jgi:hypothetical protein
LTSIALEAVGAGKDATNHAAAVDEATAVGTESAYQATKEDAAMTSAADSGNISQDAPLTDAARASEQTPADSTSAGAQGSLSSIAVKSTTAATMVVNVNQTTEVQSSSAPTNNAIGTTTTAVTAITTVLLPVNKHSNVK